MSVKRQEIQQELFGGTEQNHMRVFEDDKESKTLENLKNMSEIPDSLEKLEILDRTDNMLFVKETSQNLSTEKVDADVKSEPTFEQGVGRLEEIIGNLEQRDIPLEQALALFREGVGLVQVCNRMLDQAEAQMQILLEGPDGGLKVEKADL